ncbi:hypothetical protein [Lysobacter capsici]|uniref:hypothetical protein n=1 Tax=Lysobacter capsici TaxID=435897 RepID=UPI00287B8801|nr:hypothetical protein [Lysobacter capsici]WND79437.1 hypothetical protein RJ610_19350 [Lysobacter capsici]WND84633.1 hypothetical protein RJ609_19365 [Lysobacter capsici]
MSGLVFCYLGLAAYFTAVDLFSGWIAGSPCRPFAAAALGLFWPASTAIGLIGAAMVVKDLRDQIAEEKANGRG